MPERARRTGRLLLVALCAGAAAGALAAQPPDGIVGTKHDLSAVSGPGPVKATAEDRICVFCHTPHNATPLSPLWNRDLAATNYLIYESSTQKAVPQQMPGGATKLCLSCHDGMIAMGDVSGTDDIPMAQNDFSSGSLSDFGTDLSAHHPVAFSYGDAMPNAELASAPPPDLTYGGADEVHCTTCHDPHDDTYGRFLAKDNQYSALCITCHEIPGWTGSPHQSDTDFSVVDILPRPPKTWPTWTTVAEWGCETCHTPHFAPIGPQLLNFSPDLPEPFSCTTGGCHGSDPGPPHVADIGRPSFGNRVRSGRTNLAGQVRKASAHHERPGGATGTGELTRATLPGVACADCHDPHAMADRAAEAPMASGLVAGVAGVDRSGLPVDSARYEYEICFRCHGDDSADREFVPRVVASVNTRREFDPSNPSYHPVVAPGRTFGLPSIPSALEPTLDASQILYCTTCHADDDGTSRGPHGSDYAPILRERYETADGTAESAESYALCYRCHDRQSILADEGFPRSALGAGGGHSGHLAAGISCAACHDPHGIDATGPASIQATGSHTHLINFDSRTVLPLPGADVPVFSDGGERTGSCSLVCHGVAHQATRYP